MYQKILFIFMLSLIQINQGQAAQSPWAEKRERSSFVLSKATQSEGQRSENNLRSSSLSRQSFIFSLWSWGTFIVSFARPSQTLSADPLPPRGVITLTDAVKAILEFNETEEEGRLF